MTICVNNRTQIHVRSSNEIVKSYEDVTETYIYNISVGHLGYHILMIFVQKLYTFPRRMLTTTPCDCG